MERKLSLRLELGLWRSNEMNRQTLECIDKDRFDRTKMVYIFRGGWMYSLRMDIRFKWNEQIDIECIDKNRFDCTCIYLCFINLLPVDRQTERRMDGQTDRRTDRQTDTQTNRQGQISIQIETDSQIDRQTDRQTNQINLYKHVL